MTEKQNLAGGVDPNARSKDKFVTGGASAFVHHDVPASFEDYMKKRASENGGKVIVGDQDVTEAKPTYELTTPVWDGSKSNSWNPGAGSKYVKQDETGAWVDAGTPGVNDFTDKSIEGFDLKQDTSWLFENEEHVLESKAEKDKAKKEEEDAIEAKMALWLKQAEEKKAKEGK